MNRFFRYALVGILALSMAVDPVAARRLFQRSSCCRECRSVCTKVCPPACPVSCSSTDYVSPCVATEMVIVPERVVADPVCQGCNDTMQPEIMTEEHIAPFSPPAEVLGPVDEYIPFGAVDSPAAPPSESILLPPAPVAFPEVNEPADSDTIAPAPIERPAKEIVGDRYSEGDIFGPPSPQEFIAPQPSKPAGTNDTADLFGDPITPAEEEIPSEAPMPEFVEPPEAEPEPEPQPEVDDDDLFGQTEPATSESVASENGEEQPADQPEDATEESESAEPIEPGEPAEAYDPFGENSSHPDVDVLEQAGGLLSKADRTWTDNTATFQCWARLLRVTAQGVTLQQATGKKVQVPLARLGTGDLHFVRQQITALRVVRAHDAAAEKLAVAWTR